MGQEPSLKVVRQVAGRLFRVYGNRPRGPRRPPLDELIFTILSQNTSDTNRDRAWTSLREAFPNWTAVLKGKREAVAEAIRAGGLANQKSGRIQGILAEILRREGRLSLDRLHERPAEEVKGYLEAFEGVGPKTSACVLLFSLGRPAFPVDTHIHRLATRLGWLPEKSTSEEAHERLAELVPADLSYPLHVGLIAHGRATCRAHTPRCTGCVLLDLCPTGQERVSPDVQ